MIKNNLFDLPNKLPELKDDILSGWLVGPTRRQIHGLLVPRRGGLPNGNQQTSKFIHELSMLRDFCGGKRAEGDQRVGGCPVPALGPSCLNDGYSKTIDEKHIVYEGNW